MLLAVVKILDGKIVNIYGRCNGERVDAVFTFSLVSYRDDFAPWFFKYNDDRRIEKMSSD